MKSNEIYKLVNTLVDIELRLEEAQETYKLTAEGAHVVNEALVHLHLKRVERALKTLKDTESKLLDLYTEKAREEKITSNLFD